MQAVQINLRRWCRACGLPSPANRPRCVHCNADPQVRPHGTLRDVSSTNNVGENVQHNVINVENLYQADNDETDSGFREIHRQLAAVAAAPTPTKDSLLRRFFMFTCTVAIWISILMVTAFFIGFVTLMVMWVRAVVG